MFDDLLQVSITNRVGTTAAAGALLGEICFEEGCVRVMLYRNRSLNVKVSNMRNVTNKLESELTSVVFSSDSNGIVYIICDHWSTISTRIYWYKIYPYFSFPGKHVQES